MKQKRLPNSHYPTPRFRLSAAVLAASVLLCGLSAQANTVLKDDMNYDSTTALRAAWTKFDGSDPNLGTSVNLSPEPLKDLRPIPAGGSFMSLGNGLVYRNLSSTVTGDWTLSFKVLSTSYSRSATVLLLDSTGTQGYGVSFNTALVDNYSGQGLIGIVKFDNSSYTNWSSFGTGTILASGGSTGHAVTGYDVTQPLTNNQNEATYNTDVWNDFMQVTLSWSSSTGTLVLSVNGTQLATTTDQDFSEFGRIYLRGNSNSYFDAIEVTTAIPEKSTMSLLLGAAVMGACALYRRR